MTIQFGSNPAPLLTDATATGAGPWIGVAGPVSAIQVTSTGGTATVDIEFSNDGVNPVGGLVTPFSMTTSNPSQGAVAQAPFTYIRAKVAAIAGATVQASVSY